MFSRLTSLVTGQSLPFTLGEDKGQAWNWWSLHDAKMKADGASVSVFKAVIPTSDDVKLGLARNSLKRLRGLKHPSIVSFKDSLEVADRSNVTFYIVTEQVTTLGSFLSHEEMQGGSAKEVLAWGLRAVVSGVSFLTNECKVVYGTLCFNSVFVSQTLDWKLGVFDLLSDHNGMGKALDPQPFVQGFSFVGAQYLPGEVHKKEWHVVADSPPWAIDAWGLGCFIRELFKGGAMSAVAELRDLQGIPKVLAGDYQRLLGSQPQRRLNPAQLLGQNSFFRTKLNDIVVFLESLILKEEVERNKFFRGLKQACRSLPGFLIQQKILPACLAAVEFGNVSTAALQAILDLVQFGGDEKYFETSILPFIIKLLGSPDVSVRLMLLQSIDKFVRLLSEKMVESQLYPGMQQYFKDPDPRMRDQTIKCMSVLAPKMTQKTLNSSLLQHLAQLQRDPEAAIRTNTTVLISKISQYLGEASCKRILLNAFTRVLNDPAPTVRKAGILALKETSQYYSEEDISRKLIPTLAPLVTDPDPSISVSSFQCVEENLKILRAYAKKREEELAAATAAAAAAAPTASSMPPKPSQPVANNSNNNIMSAYEAPADASTSLGASVGQWKEEMGDDLILDDDEGGWDDDMGDQLDEMLRGEDASSSDPLSSLNDSVNKQMSDLMTGPSSAAAPTQGGSLMDQSIGSPRAQRKHIAAPRAPRASKPSRKPMKLGATKRQSKSGDDDAMWGDLLNS